MTETFIDNAPNTNRPPELDMQYDQLAAQPTLHEVPTQLGTPIDIDLDHAELVAQSGMHKLIAVANVEASDGSQRLNVWVTPTTAGPVVSLGAGDADPTQEHAGFRGYAVARPGVTGYFRQPRSTQEGGINRLGVVPREAMRESELSFTVSPDGRALRIADDGTKNRTTFLLRDSTRPKDEVTQTAFGTTMPRSHYAPKEVAPSQVTGEATAPRSKYGAPAVTGMIERPDTAPVAAYESDSSKRTRRHIYEGVSHDPDYQKVAEPYRAELDRLKNIYGADHEAYKRASQPIRDAFEAAIKPTLRERLELSKYDEGPAYLLGIETIATDPQTGRRGLVNSVTKKPVSNEPPRLGAVTLPGRMKTWAGSEGGKRNEFTGKVTTTSEHIIDIAAARLAGKWDSGRASKDPIVISRDYAAELQLATMPREYEKLKLWKVEIGQHRVAAARLVEGVDATIPYDRIEERENRYAHYAPRR